jgi:hypothetical protein
LTAWGPVPLACDVVEGDLEGEADADAEAEGEADGEAPGWADAAAAARVAGLAAAGVACAPPGAVGAGARLGAAVGVALGSGLFCGWGLVASTGCASSEQPAAARNAQPSARRSRTSVLTEEPSHACCVTATDAGLVPHIREIQTLF